MRDAGDCIASLAQSVAVNVSTLVCVSGGGRSCVSIQDVCYAGNKLGSHRKNQRVPALTGGGPPEKFIFLFRSFFSFLFRSIPC